MAVDGGVFHNDVVAVGNQNVLLWHASAFADPAAGRLEIESAYRQRAGRDPILIEVSAEQVPLADAVQSYLFNSQLVTSPRQLDDVNLPGRMRADRQLRANLSLGC